MRAIGWLFLATRISYFDALVPYYGGKRRLLGRIFRYLPEPSVAAVLADVFLGGGSVSLYAKARGYRVHCNDLADRSVLVGRALIANDRLTISAEDLLRLFVPNACNTGFIESQYCPDVVTSRHARFLDNALAVARGAAEPKRSLLLLLCLKYLFRQRPMGNFGARTLMHQMEEGAWDEMNPSFVKKALVEEVTAHPKTIAEKLRRQVNRGVFAGAGPCTVSQLDAATFLSGVEADIAYMDPPYAGTLDYGKALKVVDHILLGATPEPVASPFSGAGWRAAMDELFAAGRHIPIWAISYGNAGGRGVDLDTLVEVVRRHRTDIDAHEIQYEHCAGLAGADSRTRNRELLVIAKK